MKAKAIARCYGCSFPQLNRVLVLYGHRSRHPQPRRPRLGGGRRRAPSLRPDPKTYVISSRVLTLAVRGTDGRETQRMAAVW